MKETATEKILRMLQRQTEATTAILDVMLCSRDRSYKKLLATRFRQAPRFQEEWATIYRERQKIYSLLNHLRTQGLITKSKESGRTIWSLNDKGKARLKKQDVYPKELSAGVMVISYDIPEPLRKERGWLRNCLRLLDFEMAHQSLWIGKYKIPKGLLNELQHKKLLDSIHIFEIGTTGTLKKIK